VLSITHERLIRSITYELWISQGRNGIEMPDGQKSPRASTGIISAVRSQYHR
jgi:hypothetical protein